MKKSELFTRAAKLRSNGYSLNEISQLLNISKSTASNWMAGVIISKKGRKRLGAIKEKAIIKSREIKKLHRLRRFDEIKKNCTVLRPANKYGINDYKIFLSLLFWCEGSKNDRRVVFMNSDPVLIKTYLNLLRRAFIINENKLRATLHLHTYHDSEKEVSYWAKLTGIKPQNIGIYKKTNSGLRKKPGYAGCISIRYGDVRIFEELNWIISRFSKLIVAGVG